MKCSRHASKLKKGKSDEDFSEASPKSLVGACRLDVSGLFALIANSFGRHFRRAIAAEMSNLAA